MYTRPRTRTQLTISGNEGGEARGVGTKKATDEMDTETESKEGLGTEVVRDHIS